MKFQRPTTQAAVRYGLVLIFFMLVLGWVYSPVMTQTYGWNDDYQLLKRVAERSLHLTHNEYVDGGRPLFGVAVKFLFSTAKSIDGLKKGRCISVAGILVFALSAFAILRRIGFGGGFSAASALVMCLTPGFAIYAGWLTQGFNSYNATVALVAGNLIGATLETSGLLRRSLYFCLGAVLLLLIYATYQPVAAFAVIPLLGRAWRDFKIDWQRTGTFALGIGMLMGVAVFYFIGYKVFSAVYHPGGEAERATLTKDIFGNIRFVVNEVLWSGATGWSQFHAPWVQSFTALVVMVVIVSAGLARPLKNLTSPLPGLICLALALVVTVLPLVVLKEKIFAFRMQTALHATVGFAFVIGLERLISCVFSPALAAQLKNICFACLIGMAAVLTHYHLDRDFVAPNAAEVAVLTGGIERLKAFPDRLVYIVPAQGTEPGDNIAEFRYGSAALPWVAPSMLELLFIQVFEKDVPLRKALRHHPKFMVEYGPANPDSVPVLDGFTLLNGESATLPNDSYWGTIRTNQNGWCSSDWFGVFDNRHFPTIYHSQLGWLTCSGGGTNDFLFNSPIYGSFSTSPKTFPALYFIDNSSRFLLAPTIAPSCSFYDTKKKTWTLSPESQ